MKANISRKVFLYGILFLILFLGCVQPNADENNSDVWDDPSVTAIRIFHKGSSSQTITRVNVFNAQDPRVPTASRNTDIPRDKTFAIAMNPGTYCVVIVANNREYTSPYFTLTRGTKRVTFTGSDLMAD